MKITLSGLPGSGTTTVAKILSERLNLEYISAGIIFRRLAKESGLSLAEFGKMAENDSEFDLMIDKRQKEVATGKDDILVEGRLSGFMIDSDLKIWIDAPLDVRAKRISERENIPLKEATEDIIVREACEHTRYISYYNIDLKDRHIYDIIIDSSKLDPHSIVDKIISALGENPNSKYPLGKTIGHANTDGDISTSPEDQLQDMR
ncbi:MAG: AAA family ATPase [Halobacteriota archaeon]|nr:AAA family ATPase [Halobacteriota archaeon]